MVDINMACVNISESMWLNSSTSGEVDELRSYYRDEDVDDVYDNFGFNLTSALHNSLKNELAGVVCMADPQQMLDPWKIYKNLPMLISYSLTFMIGVVGNITAMLGMIGDRKSRNATTLFLVSLSAADLLLLLVCAPLEVLQYFVIQWDEAGTICKLAKYAEMLSAVASVLNLTAVSLERFIVIVFPIRSRSLCTMSNCRRAVAVVWLISLLLTAPVLLTKGTNPLTFTDGVESVTINYCEDKGDGRIFAIYQAVILLAAPGLIMIICYTYVIRELWISTRNMRVMTNTTRYNQGNLDSRWRGGGKHRWQYHFGSRGAATQTVLHLASTEVGSRLDSEDCSLMVSNSSPRQVPISRAQSAPTQCQLCQTHLTLQQPASTPSSKSLLSIRASTALRVNLTRSGAKQISGHQARAKDIRNARKQVIKMLILVIILFLICWGSRLSMEISIKVGLDNYSREMYALRIVINLLPYIHSCINPFIYSLMSKNFRRSMWRRWQRLSTAFTCCCHSCCIPTTLSSRRCLCHHSPTSPSSSPCLHCQLANSNGHFNSMQYSMNILDTPLQSSGRLLHHTTDAASDHRSTTSYHGPPKVTRFLRRHQSMYSTSIQPNMRHHRDGGEFCLSSV